jgi:hypothetical protein
LEFKLIDNTKEYHDRCNIKTDKDIGELEIPLEWTKNFTVETNQTIEISLRTKSNAIGDTSDFMAVIFYSLYMCDLPCTKLQVNLMQNWLNSIKNLATDVAPNAFILECVRNPSQSMQVLPVFTTQWNVNAAKYEYDGLEILSYGNANRTSSNLSYFKNKNSFIYYQESAGIGIFPILNNLQYRTEFGYFPEPVDILYFDGADDNDYGYINNIRLLPYSGDEASMMNQIPNYDLYKIIRFLDFNMDYINFDIAAKKRYTHTFPLTVYLGKKSDRKKAIIPIYINPVILNNNSYENMNQLGVPDDKGKYYAFEISLGEIKYPDGTYYYINNCSLFNPTALRDGKIIIGLEKYDSNRSKWKFKDATINIGSNTANI